MTITYGDGECRPRPRSPAWAESNIGSLHSGDGTGPAPAPLSAPRAGCREAASRCAASLGRTTADTLEDTNRRPLLAHPGGDSLISGETSMI